MSHRKLGHVIERGIVCCRRCGAPHDKRYVLGSRTPWGTHGVSWADPVDGHVYEKESAEGATLRWRPATAI